MFKFGYVAVLGKPNAGKSTLINRLVGETVAIVSSKPQTTRENIVGVVNGKDYQIAFLDTPGIHKTSTYLDKFMMKNVRSAKSGADVILYLIDSSKEADEDEIKSIEKMKKDGLNVVVAKSKCDKRKKNDFLADIEFSAETGENFDYTSSIDDQTYNRIKLVYEDSESGKREIFTAQDKEGTMKKWGTLQYYEAISDTQNAQNKANALLSLYNSKTKKLKITALGDVRVRAGSYVVVRLNIGDVTLDNFMMVEKCDHKFKDNEHTMTLTLRGGEFVA